MSPTRMIFHLCQLPVGSLQANLDEDEIAGDDIEYFFEPGCSWAFLCQCLLNVAPFHIIGLLMSTIW